MDINKGVNQEGLKKEFNVPIKTKGAKNLQLFDPTSAKNQARALNERAKGRLDRITRNIATIDAIQAFSRLKIGNLPLGLRSKLIQRIMYYRGNAIGYKDFVLEKYFFLPYSLIAEDDQSIDFYGQYTRVRPMSFNGKSTDNRNPKTGENIDVKIDKKTQLKIDAVKSALKEEKDPEKRREIITKSRQEGVYLGTITRIPVYDMKELDALINSKGKEWCQQNLCVIFRDYTNLMSENNVARQEMQAPFIEMQAEVLPMLRTVMLKAAMPKLLRGDQNARDSMLAEIDAIEAAILAGETIIPITAWQDIQEINSPDTGRVVEVFAMMYEGYNNIRKTFLGIPNDGAFKKNAHILQDEQDKNSISADQVLDDCLENMKESFDMFNKLFDESVTVEISGAAQSAAQEIDDDADADDAPGGEEGGEGGNNIQD